MDLKIISGSELEGEGPTKGDTFSQTDLTSDLNLVVKS